jgi:glycine cleavage system regulatory protein
LLSARLLAFELESAPARLEAVLMASIILTLVGPDRPGLVREISERVLAHGGSWLESRMTRLAGQFAGIARVELADDAVGALTTALHDLEPDGYRVVVQGAIGEAPDHTKRSLELDVIGQDRPGIVRAITGILTAQNINIEELTTNVVSGSFSGETLFQAEARLRVPDEVDLAALQHDLERLGDELMVEIKVNAPPAPAA